MKSRQTFFNAIVVLLALSPIAFLLIVWNSVPETFKVRFSFDEPVVKEGNRQTLILTTIIFSIIAAAMFLLMRNLRKIDPRVKAHTPVSSFNKIGFLLAIFLTLFNYLFILTAVYSWEISEKAIFILAGLLFALLGNYMSNIKPNYFVGMRLPWTLNDENNWRQTHQLAGKLWFAGGLLLALLSWLLPQSATLPVFISVIAIMVLIPGIYSYRLHKAKN